jgi:hypothetical protein
LISLIAGPEEAKNRAGKESLRLIQIRLATPSLQKSSPACQSRKPSLESPTQVRRQLFSGAHVFCAGQIPTALHIRDWPASGFFRNGRSLLLTRSDKRHRNEDT